MRYYFLGIAGTAMASLAVLLKQKGHDVWGSDQGIYPPMSDFLAAHRIPVRQGFSEKHLETPFDVAVIGNVLSRGNVEIEAILNRRLPFTSLPELIRKEFIDHHENIVITGTHGKTTTTALMSWVLEFAGLSPTFIIGGIAKNFDSSIQLGRGKYFVIEGDEYDCAFFDKRPKFAHYFPDYLMINNIEFDHADIYRDLEAIKDVFRKLVRIIPSHGLVIANGENAAVREIIHPVYSRLQTFGDNDQQHWFYRVLATRENGTHFEIYRERQLFGEFQFPYPGKYQLQNALAVVAVAHDLGISEEKIREALSTFKGVKRRLEYWGKLFGADVYDDFAHHPTAIKVTLEAMQGKFPGRRLIALFEPRTNTTVRNVFQEELYQALNVADVIILTPIFRLERLPASERLSMEKLLKDLRQHQREVYHLEDYSQIPDQLEQVLQKGDILILLTNGSLGGEYQKLRETITPG
jgi:UDP-N-acetylmuramate: L-alanyl-gamma-D-glutamyl-meso-diaminopimelate ligase